MKDIEELIAEFEALTALELLQYMSTLPKSSHAFHQFAKLAVAKAMQGAAGLGTDLKGAPACK